mgnify:CR=1 FL=1
MIQFHGSRGTNASPTIVQNDNLIGTINARAYDGNSYGSISDITFEVDGAPGDGDMPARIVFRTSPSGSETPTERLRIDSNGLIANNARVPSSFGSPNLLISGTDSTLTLMGDGSSNNSSFTGIKFRVAGASTGDYTKAGIFAQRQGGYNDLDLIFALDTVADATSVAIADEKMRITSSGDLGLGTASPSSKLHILAGGGSCIIELQRDSANTTGNVGCINFTASDGHSVANMGAYGDGDNEGAYINFKTTSAASANSPFSSTTERLRIGSLGQIGIAGANYGSDNQALTSQGSSSAVEWRGINGPVWDSYQTVSYTHLTLPTKRIV